MPPAPRRGSIVARGGRYGMVWSVADDLATVLPVERPGVPATSGEVAIGEGPLAGMVVRAEMCRVEPVADLGVICELPAAAVCRVVLAVARMRETQLVESRWA